jgi:DNA-binding NtrC family response regulator
MIKAKLLIMHPEPSALALLTSMLTSLAYEIVEARNDRMAVRLMERGDVDLLVADVDPTDVEAWELLSYMRRKHCQVPVILLLKAQYHGHAREAARQGALMALKYPVPATELRAAVAQALGPRVASSTAAPPTTPTTPPAIPSPGPSPSDRSHPPMSISIRSLREALEEPERRIIIQALQALNWNRQETARVLDINRTTLYKKMKKYKILDNKPVMVN